MIKIVFACVLSIALCAQKSLLANKYCLCQNAGQDITKQCFALFSSSLEEQNTVCQAKCKQLPKTPVFTGMIGVDIKDFSGTPLC